MIRITSLIALVAPMLIAAAPATRPTVLRIPGTTVEFTMVKLPDGKIDIAIPKQEPAEVQLKSFWIGLTEVTWDEFDVFALGLDFTDNNAKIAEIGKTRPSPPYGDPGHGQRQSGNPAMSVHPQSAEAYCKWLSAKMNRKFRLPTEAEWEYACRAGLPPARLPEPQLGPLAWYAANSTGDDDEPIVRPVAKKAPNAFGLYDTLGNVAEWTIGENHAPFARGGAYKDDADRVHCRSRIPNNDGVLQRGNPQNPKSQWWLSDGPHIGFRIVMEE